jgi:hypothetical protein
MSLIVARSPGAKVILLAIVVLAVVAVLMGNGAITTSSGCRAHAQEQGWERANWFGLGIGFCLED